jgi:hypothetical protein
LCATVVARNKIIESSLYVTFFAGELLTHHKTRRAAPCPEPTLGIISGDAGAGCVHLSAAAHSNQPPQIQT